MDQSKRANNAATYFSSFCILTLGWVESQQNSLMIHAIQITLKLRFGQFKNVTWLSFKFPHKISMANVICQPSAYPKAGIIAAKGIYRDNLSFWAPLLFFTIPLDVLCPFSLIVPAAACESQMFTIVLYERCIANLWISFPRRILFRPQSLHYDSSF